MSIPRRVAPYYAVAAAALFLLAFATPWSSAEPAMVLVEGTGVDDHAPEVGIAYDDLRLGELFDPEQELGALVTLHAPAHHQRVTLRLPGREEAITDAHLTEMREILRCHQTQRRHRIDPKLAAAIGRVAARFPGREIEVVSGYRARGGVKRSRHFTGQAIDFRVVGVKASVVRDFVWATMDHVGVGHYHSKGFIHLDVRPKLMSIGWDQWRERGKYHYHPRWTANTAAAI